jgi:hypothetical protein
MEAGGDKRVDRKKTGQDKHSSEPPGLSRRM